MPKKSQESMKKTKSEESRMMSEHERWQLLCKLEKELTFAGVSVPETIEIKNEKFPLKSYIFEMVKRKGTISKEEQEAAYSLIAELKRKKKALIEEIKKAPITRERGNQLLQLIFGIDRAIDILYHLDKPKPSLVEEMRKARVADERRWLDLIKKISQKDLWDEKFL
ncbi:MAG: DUF5788 family protein [Halobacteria archaeon]